MAHTGYYSESSSFDNVNQAVAQASLYKDQAAASAAAAAASKAGVDTSAMAAASSAAASLASSTSATTQAQAALNSATNAAGSSALAAASQVAAAASAAAVQNQTLFSFKNRLHNGAFTVSQRVTPVAYTTQGPVSSLDRWFGLNSGAGGSFQVGITQISSGGISIPAASAYATSAMTDSSGNKYWIPFYQKIEGYNMMDLVGKAVTVSFLFTCRVTGTYSVALQDGPTVSVSCVKTFVAQANQVTNVVLTFPAIPTNANSRFGVSTGLTLIIGGYNTGNFAVSAAQTDYWIGGNYFCLLNSYGWPVVQDNYIAVAEVQLELGGNATPFERRPYGVELQLCQRYFFKGASRWDGFVSNGVVQSNTVNFPVPMRSNPTITVTNTLATSVAPNSAIYIQNVNLFTEAHAATATTGGAFASTYTVESDLS